MFKVQTADIAADAVTAAKLPDDVIDSEHYAAGSIDTAHLADDAVTLAKMVAGTDGVIITYDASGNPAHVGPGSDGEVLTSTGAGSPPAFEAAAGGPSQANQAALEAETNEDTYAPPDLIKYSPGVAKAWASVEMIGTATMEANYNVSGFADDGVGLFTLTWGDNFSAATYAASGMASSYSTGSDEAIVTMRPGARAVGACQFLCVDVHNAADDIDLDAVGVVMFGDQ